MRVNVCVCVCVSLCQCVMCVMRVRFRPLMCAVCPVFKMMCFGASDDARISGVCVCMHVYTFVSVM